MESPLAKALAQRYAPTVAAGFGAKSKLAAALSPEEDYLHSLSPVDAHKFAVEARNARTYTPEQAKSNLSQTMMDAAYVTPVLGNILSAKDAYTYGKATMGATDTTEQRKNALLTELSALGAVTGLPFGNAASRAAKGAASRTNIFAGPMAKTADHAALENAQRLESAGANRDEIWSQTGWFKGTDGKWRFEIDDSGAALTGVKPPETPTHASTFSGISHPEYEAAYGDYMPREVAGVFDPRAKEMGNYSSHYNAVFAQGPTPQAAKGVGLHEYQHHTQDLEDFAQGSSPYAELTRLPTDTGNSIVEQLRKGIADGDYGQPGEHSFADAYKQLRALEETVNEKRARDLYRLSAGEVEARNVQGRMNMTAAERRAKAPWLTQDVPDEQQIVRFGNNGPQMSAPKDIQAAIRGNNQFGRYRLSGHADDDVFDIIRDDGVKVGDISAAHDSKGIVRLGPIIDKQHQREGIASDAYRHILKLAEQNGMQVQRSDYLTPAGEALWKSLDRSR